MACNIGKEIGTALAVLAIYLLTFLAPLHHARASQLAFEQLGYVTLQTGWALCTPAGLGGDKSNGAHLFKCPAAGMGKNDIAAPLLGPVLPAFDAAVLELSATASPPLHGLTPMGPPGGPRGPPLTV